jgi:hypothetical protein
MQNVATPVVTGAVYSGLTCLHSLYLDQCDISSFDQIQNIRTLNATLDLLSLTGNLIETVPEELLHYLFRMSQLMLQQNKIQVYPEVKILRKEYVK